MQERTYCEQCGTFRFKPAAEKRAIAAERVACSICGEAFARRHMSTLGAGPICPNCVEDGRWKEAAPAASPAPALLLDSGSNSPITFGGHAVDAPGFTADQFERAICRALVDQLEIHYDATGETLVCHKGLTGGYKTTRTSCTCKAGEVGTPCKHRAALIFHLDVREPAIRRQWAEARKAVA